MQRFVGRLVKSSWSNAPTRRQQQLRLASSFSRGNSGLFNGEITYAVLEGRLTRRGSRQPRGQVHYSTGPYWFLEEDFIKQIGKKPEPKPEDGPKRPWWENVEYPKGILEKKRSKSLKELEPISAKSAPLLPRNYLVKHPVTSDQVVRHLFGENYKQFHDFMREARVERMYTLGKLLVDDSEVRTDHDYWLKLLKFRARIHGEKGVKDIWFGITMRRIELPVKGDTANAMWRLFVRVGLEDEDFLSKLYKYHILTHFGRGTRRWKPMYREVVGGFIRKKKFLRALWWHYRLIDQNPSTAWVNFFEEYATEPGNLPVLFRIFSSKKIRPLYDTIIPFLGRHELYHEALKWNKMLLSKGDVPAESHHADRLFEYLAFHAPLKDLELFLRDFHRKGIKLKESTVISLIKARYRAPPIMELLCELYGKGVVPNDCFGDKFWAFLLSYQRISEPDVTKYMTRLNIKGVGEFSTREFIKRGKTIGSFIRGMTLLEMKKMSAGSEISNKYLEVKAKWLPDEALQESLPIENLDAAKSNALLQGYLSTYRWKHFNMVYLKLRRKNPQTWNLFLRKLLISQQIRDALELMEEMRILSIPIWSPAQRELLRAILLPRRRGRRPIHRDLMSRKTKDLYLATNYLRAIMLNGDTVHPTLWRDILKRYGMFSKLRELERLCLWLVEWYNPRKAALQQTKTPVKFTRVRDIASLAYDKIGWIEPPVGFDSRSPQNALRVIFPATTIRSLVEWGFIAMQRAWYLRLTQGKGRLKVKALFSWSTWGIRLVRSLQQNGVWVDARSVARAVRVRLRALEGSRQMWESFDANISKQERIDLGEMAAIAEKAWGGRLFPHGSWNTEQGLMRMLKAPVRDLVIGRRRARSRRIQPARNDIPSNHMYEKFPA